MCTLTYSYHKESLWVGFNRDEQLSREAGLSPQLYEKNGVQYLSPLDGKSKGTWIGVNHFGAVVCLLNYYDKTPQNPNTHVFKSRGELVSYLLSLGGLNTLCQTLQDMDFSIYLPFRLVLLGRDEAVFQYAWDGQRLVVEPAALPVVSSSYDVVSCRQTRGEAYASFEFIPDAGFDSLLAYHGSHLPEKGALSVCVHRPEVETVSFTGIHVTDSFAEMVYTSGSPCSMPLMDPVRLTF